MRDSAGAKEASTTSTKRKAKDMFGDCALVEIVHLHDCFRGALKSLSTEVSELCREVVSAAEGGGGGLESSAAGLARRVSGRFTVIWSVFQAHSAAEDEHIWPALKAKQFSLPDDGGGACGCNRSGSAAPLAHVQDHLPRRPSAIAPVGLQAAEVAVAVAGARGNGDGEDETRRERAHSMSTHRIEQEEYEEDHADEERMFHSVNGMLSRLREGLSICRAGSSSPAVDKSSLHDLARTLQGATADLVRHLMIHLDKEETDCMPLVVQYLTKAEINDLVGKIMGKRSSDLISQILTMAVQNLNEADRDDMVRYMKQAMVGTFFERWLKMEGWDKAGGDKQEDECGDGGGKMPPNEAGEESKRSEIDTAKQATKNELLEEATSRAPPAPAWTDPAASSATTSSGLPSHNGEDKTEKYTSAAELEKLIRAIGTNPHLDSKQKNLTIQGLRDSAWKSNCRLSKRKRVDALASQQSVATRAASSSAALGATAQSSRRAESGGLSHPSHHMSFSVPPSIAMRFKRETPPSLYFKKTKEGGVTLVWSSDPHSKTFHPNDGSVPLFSASELAPTYHDPGINHVLGCPHYARSCKLRHPTSGRLYTCRLCCEQTREMENLEKDSPLDRYEVREILCMICGALQPAGDACVNPDCPSSGKPFARYTCRICNFYDDSPFKSAYHCPFCNVCRSGRGLGIDYRHCMRCNACVSLTDDHHCIPQTLQGNCPICHETMFQSTEPLRGLRCGHVMHLSCFTMYMRGHNYTCPLCKKSADDMGEYFALLDSAVRMQPMPPAYAATRSNIFCQDCCEMGNVSYHFAGLKCPHCGSYNTRELQRVDANIMAGLWQGH